MFPCSDVDLLFLLEKQAAAAAAACVEISIVLDELDDPDPVSVIESSRYLSWTIVPDDETVPETEVSGVPRLRAVCRAPDENASEVFPSTPVMLMMPEAKFAADPAPLATLLLPTDPILVTAA